MSSKYFLYVRDIAANASPVILRADPYPIEINFRTDFRRIIRLNRDGFILVPDDLADDAWLPVSLLENPAVLS